MGNFNFKSVGKTSDQKTSESAQAQATPKPIGIVTPIRQANNGDLVAMHTSLLEQVHDDLKNLLMTNFGEHLGVYALGGNLLPIAFEFNDQDAFDSEATKRINEAVSKWMPYVSLENYVSEFNVNQNNDKNFQGKIIRITVTYSVPQLSTEIRALQIELQVPS
jgi:phage baseplate assembly protein W